MKTVILRLGTTTVGVTDGSTYTIQLPIKFGCEVPFGAVGDLVVSVPLHVYVEEDNTVLLCYLGELGSTDPVNKRLRAPGMANFTISVPVSGRVRGAVLVSFGVEVMEVCG